MKTMANSEKHLKMKSLTVRMNKMLKIAKLRKILARKRTKMVKTLQKIPHAPLILRSSILIKIRACLERLKPNLPLSSSRRTDLTPPFRMDLLNYLMILSGT